MELGETYIYPTILKQALKAEGFPPVKAMRDLAEKGGIETSIQGKDTVFSIVRKRHQKSIRVVHLLNVDI